MSKVMKLTLIYSNIEKRRERGETRNGKYRKCWGSCMQLVVTSRFVGVMGTHSTTEETSHLYLRNITGSSEDN